MNRARAAVLILFSLMVGAGQVPSGAPSSAQTFEIFMKGEPVGTEVVTETTDKDGNIVSRSEHEMLVSDGLEVKRVAFNTELVLAKGSLQPIRYKLQYTSGQSHDSCEVTSNGKQLTRILLRGNRKSEASTPLVPGMVVLESNVYHLYEYLVRQYDRKKGGRQMFQAYLPPVGAEVPAALTRMEDSKLDLPGGPVPVANFRYEFVALLNGLLSVDASGRLVRLVSPGQELEVRRR
ncbi:MAG: hypothetical protein HXY20_08865 [Acidobacteria bacterium]|nr:hypothetical protein [Acidobacteriota bacterium]